MTIGLRLGITDVSQTAVLINIDNSMNDADTVLTKMGSGELFIPLPTLHSSMDSYLLGTAIGIATLSVIALTLLTSIFDRRVAAQLIERERRLQKQSSVLVELARRKPLNYGNLTVAVREITEAAARTLELRWASVWLYDSSHTKIRCLDLYDRSTDSHLAGMELTATRYPAYFSALKQERTIAAADAHTDPRTKEFSDFYLSKHGIASLLHAPIRVSGQTVGVVCHEHTGTIRQWTLEEQNFAGSIADLVALAVEASERVSAEVALKQSQQKLALHFQQTPVAALERDLNFEVTEWNPAAEGIFGYSQSEVIGRQLDELILPVGVRKHLDKDYIDLLKCSGSDRSTTENVTKDGKSIICEWYDTPLIDSYGNVIGLASLVQDITERERAAAELEIRVEERTIALRQVNEQLRFEIAERSAAEAALQRSEAQSRRLVKQEKLLNRLAGQIRNSLDLDTILETTVQAVRDLLQIDRCGFAWYHRHTFSMLSNSDGEWEVEKEARHPHLPDLTGHYPAAAAGPLIQKLLSLEPIRVDDVSTLDEPISRQFLLSLGKRSFMALPVQTQHGEIGMLLCSHCSEPRHWEDSEVELLQAVTLQIAIAIDQADLYARAQKAALVAQTQSLELAQALRQLQKTQTQLVQTEKMSSLGQLVAGVAHEINNPVTFITVNLSYATPYIKELLDVLRLYQEHYPQPATAIQERAENIDLEFLLEDLPKLVASMRLGADRISQIVLSLRNFSRFDESGRKWVNLHEGIDNTLLLLQHRLRGTSSRSPEIRIVKAYGELPLVECYPGQLNQVFMNILSNAIDALEGGVGSREWGVGNSFKDKEEWRVEAEMNTYSSAPTPQCLLAAAYSPVPTPYIRIYTEVSRPGCVTVRIADNGLGMTEAVKARVFDPFFTTKPVGSGIGLGLSISYQIVVEEHKGVLRCLSELDRGTEFWIEIPMQQSS